jgi:hypothetical protein
MLGMSKDRYLFSYPSIGEDVLRSASKALSSSRREEKGHAALKPNHCQILPPSHHHIATISLLKMPQFTEYWRKKSDEERFPQVLNERFLQFAPISYVSPHGK